MSNSKPIAVIGDKNIVGNTLFNVGNSIITNVYHAERGEFLLLPIAEYLF